jgi:hypothetical protein
MHLQPTRSLFEVEIPEARASSRLGCTHDWPPKHHTGRISDFPAWDKSIPKLRGCPLLCSWIRAPTAVVTCTHNAAGLPDLAARHEEEDKIKKKRTRSGRRRRDQEEDDEISLWRLHLLNLGSLCSTPRGRNRCTPQPVDLCPSMAGGKWEHRIILRGGSRWAMAFSCHGDHFSNY